MNRQLLLLILISLSMFALSSCGHSAKSSQTRKVASRGGVRGKGKIGKKVSPRIPAMIAGKTAVPASPTATAAAPSTSPSVAAPQSPPSAARAPQKYLPEPQNFTGISPRGIDYGITVQDVAFGSWVNQNFPQPIWAAIQDSKPDLFIFVGDTVKLEDRSYSEQYSKQNAFPEYRSFREAVPFLSVWNTQDYRVLTGQRDFVQHWSYLQHAMNLGQTGIYHSKVIGPEGKEVQFILLDTRTFRGPRLAGDKPNAPVLGEEQWRWLEEQLARPTNVKFLISTIPLIPARQDGESWTNYPVERQRLFDLIKKIKPRNLAVLSGGAKQASISHTGLKGWGQLYDITTGPLNDPSDKTAEKDERFEGPTTTQENFGVAQIDWQNRLLMLKILDSQRAIVNSASLKIH